MMEWPEIQKRLLDAAAMLKEHKAVDIGIKSSLALIPFVGGFVSEYWDRLDVHGEAQASELAAVLTKLATQEDLFQRVAERLESQGHQLLEVKLSISQIVNDIETIADDTHYTRRMLEYWYQALQFGPGRDGMALGLAMVQDAQGGSAFVEQVKQVVGQLGEEAQPAAYYVLGMDYVSKYQFAPAEAMLLEAAKDPGIQGVAIFGLAMNYQHWANELISQENYGFAKEKLEKADAYIREALRREPLDTQSLGQLGYTYKDLAYRYQSTGRNDQANEMLEKAYEDFQSVLRLAPDDPGARNGLANVALMRGDYDTAVAEGEAVVAAQPTYREAYFDLAQAYFRKIQAQGDDPALVRKAVATYQKLQELEAGNPHLPSDYLQWLQQLYAPIIASISSDN
jgi:tetratricopeptide (TPR) repeat protein